LYFILVGGKLSDLTWGVASKNLFGVWIVEVRDLTLGVYGAKLGSVWVLMLHKDKEWGKAGEGVLWASILGYWQLMKALNGFGSFEQVKFWVWALLCLRYRGELLGDTTKLT
jgi:hypothetical protein